MGLIFFQSFYMLLNVNMFLKEEYFWGVYDKQGWVSFLRLLLSLWFAQDTGSGCTVSTLKSELKYVAFKEHQKWKIHSSQHGIPKYFWIRKRIICIGRIKYDGAFKWMSKVLADHCSWYIGIWKVRVDQLNDCIS